MKEKIIIVAHGNSEKGSGHPSVKTITKSEQPLTFDEAKAYIDGAFSPEYPSVSMNEFFPLNDDECMRLFGKVPQGSGIVNTGLRRSRNSKGEEIFVLRDTNSNLSAIGLFADKNKYTVIMLACRTY